jgi:cysteine-rich repeat protein
MAAKKDKAAIKCRNGIGKAVLAVAKSAFGTINRCHAQRLIGRGSGDCNSLEGGAFSQARARALARLNLACRNDKTVVANYNGAASVGVAFDQSIFPAVQRELEQTAGALQTAPSVQGNAKALKKCHGSLGTGWGGVVVGTLQSTYKCQQQRDKRATSFGPLDPGCVRGAGKAGNVATKKIGKACSAFDGLAVGSCAGLPGCLVTEAEKAGQLIARLSFGGPAVCGNGLQDPSEACDDGNLIENDGCTATCGLPTCGDLSVNQPAEECDEPNEVNGVVGPDQPSQNCFECRLNVCGDGNVDVQEPVIEECDDGNAGANDGCTNCTKDPVRCGPNGLTVTLALDFPPGALGAGLSAVRLEINYPPPLSIPGTLFQQSVRDRVTTLLPPSFTFRPSDRDTNGDVTDDQVRVDLTTTGSALEIPGPVGRAQFDCPAGTEVRPAELPCNVPVDQLGGADGNPLPPALGALVSCVLELGATP